MDFGLHVALVSMLAAPQRIDLMNLCSLMNLCKRTSKFQLVIFQTNESSGMLIILRHTLVSMLLYYHYHMVYMTGLQGIARSIPTPCTHWCKHVPSFLHCGEGGLVVKSRLILATPWTVSCQAPLSMGFSRQEYWSGLPFKNKYWKIRVEKNLCCNNIYITFAIWLFVALCCGVEHLSPSPLALP